MKERKCIGTAVIPKQGIIQIYAVTYPFPSAPFCDVVDIDGMQYRSVSRKMIALNPHDDENKDN